MIIKRKYTTAAGRTKVYRYERSFSCAGNARRKALAALTVAPLAYDPAQRKYAFGPKGELAFNHSTITKLITEGLAIKRNGLVTLASPPTQPAVQTEEEDA